MPELGKFQMTQAKNWAGLSTDNHIGLMFGEQPQMLTKVMNRILSASGVNNLNTVLSRYPIKRLEDERDFTWKLIGAEERNISLLYAYITAGTALTGSDTGVGADGSEFTLVFAERYFTEVNVIVGEKLEVYQLQIVSEERGVDGWHQTVRLLGDNSAGMPGSELVAGKYFSKDFSPVEDTMSVKGGDIHFTSPIDMRNNFTTLRMEHKVPGKNLGKRMMTAIDGVDSEGKVKTFTGWMQYVEWQFERQWEQEKARACMYARSNRAADGTYSDLGKSGFYIKQGAGIREQMEVSNTEFYNDFTIELLESLLNDLVEGKADLNDREFLIRTGTRGASQFHKAITELGKGWVDLRGGNHPALIKGAVSPLHSNALTAGFQFTEWLAPNGIKVKLEVDSMYDDKVRNKILHPKGGVAESYRYDILYMGQQAAGEANIQRVEHTEGEFRGYSSGLRNPFTGERNIKYMGTMEDSATYTRMVSLGTAVLDPTKTATLLPTLLA